ncbi:hypothetical protein FQN50_003103 [Emmonsiellopsis sp. PD_5]|nr:hypothetical protein FQN50_003103 [Emmonsiellopsis sp. PD_5]
MAPEISGKQSAFYRIPVEILTEIARAVLDEDKPRKTVRALRLSCRRFAYLDIIQNSLFHSGSIQLETTPEELERLETSDISRLPTSIRKITFIAPKYSWITTLDGFKEILRVQAPHGPEFSPEEITQGFGAYRARANQIKTLFDSGRFEKACIAIFEKLSDPVEVTISTPYCDEWAETQTTNAPCDLRAHPHNGDDDIPKESTCMAAAAAVGDELFLAITAALAAAKKKPKVALELECVLSGNVAWMHKPKWAGIDLDGLTGLFFDARFEEGLEADDDVLDNCTMLLSSILEKCQHTLTTLHIHPTVGSAQDDNIIWPPPDRAVLALPKLEELNINHAVFRPKDFASFLLHATNLKSLYLQSTDLERKPFTSGPDYSQYKLIWTAIRRHPSRMQLECYEIIGNDWSEVSNSFHSGESPPPNNYSEDDWMEAADNDLWGYVSGRNRWTKYLRRYFASEDMDGVSSDEGSDFDEMDIG